jgi:nicotinate-nucleotide adenylyltransferase
LICFFGGTFDPIHVGHVGAAQAVRRHLNLASVRMILSARPGHRDQPGASLEDRWQMLSIACEGEDGLEADATEMSRTAPSYTVDTLLDIRARHSHDALVWTLGSDAFAGLPSWYRWREVLKLTHLVVIKRPGVVDLTGGQADLEDLLKRRRVDSLDTDVAGQILVLDNVELPDVSATQVRQRLAAGHGIEAQVPAGVATYIHKHGLYGGRRDAQRAG